MKHIVKSLYVQVLLAIVIGVTVGHFRPDLADTLKPLGDGFIKAIKMVIAPIIFLTVVVGIAGMRDMKKVGRVGAKALLYFEIVTTVALVIGLVVVNVLKPGAGLNMDPATLDAKSVSSYVQASEKPHGLSDFLLNVIPSTVVDAFAKGDILQVLFFALLFGFALAGLGARGRPVLELLEELAQVMFRVVNIIMRAAPIGAFGAMAFTVGRYGFDSLGNLAFLMGSFYLTCLLFVFLVLGGIAWFHGFNIWRFLVYIREELLLVLGTSSSESALPRLMEKLERLGCSKSVVGLVVPTGYSFNLDGTSIYLTMAMVFIAQACNINLSLGEQLTALGVLLLTSKGAAGVTGSGFVTLAATLASLHTVPVAGLALIVGIDRFMSEARAITNFIGNGVATIVVSKWENEVDEARLRRVLAGGPDAQEPAVAASIGADAADAD